MNLNLNNLKKTMNKEKSFICAICDTITTYKECNYSCICKNCNKITPIREVNNE